QKLTATPVSNSQMKLTWKASTHNVGVQGYKVLRNGSVIATVTVTTFQDSGLTPKTAYTYTVQAFDAAGNTSAQSASVKISTPLGRVLTVGPTRALKLPSQAAAQAHDGDLIAIDAGTYMGDVAIWSADNLTLRGV